MEWKYIKTLKDNNSITDIERKYKIKIPNYLKDLIIKYNGGRPEKNIFDTEKNKERVFKCLLSYNKEDRENIYIYDDLFKMNYIPFANTPPGDVICLNIKNDKIELYLHEIDKFEFVCEDIEIFINGLYKV